MAAAAPVWVRLEAFGRLSRPVMRSGEGLAWRSGLVLGRGETHVNRRATYVPAEYYMRLAGNLLCLGAGAVDAAGEEACGIYGGRTCIRWPCANDCDVALLSTTLGSARSVRVGFRSGTDRYWHRGVRRPRGLRSPRL